MKVGIMQPYFLPYLGYWQLLAAVDRYVILDDVNYIKRGWINRNRILVGEKTEFITLPLKGASQNRQINELRLFEKEKAFGKIRRMARLGYGRAPWYGQVSGLLEDIFAYEGDSLSEFLSRSIDRVGKYLNVSTEIFHSSVIDRDRIFKGQDRIAYLCEILGADTYINAEGGQSLYDRRFFEEKRMQLFFLKSSLPEYSQFGRKFVPGLSILDVLMFNSREDAVRMLQDFTLI